MFSQLTPSVLFKPLGALVSLVMLLSMTLVPQSSLARSPQISNGNGGSSGGGSGEGDPLDSNDYNSGGSGGGNVHSRSISGPGWGAGISRLISSDQMMILHVSYINNVPVFTVEIIAADDSSPEAGYVR